MAYTKILVIHNRLDKCVGYTQDPEKTSLEAAIDYAWTGRKRNRPVSRPPSTATGRAFTPT